MRSVSRCVATSLLLFLSATAQAASVYVLDRVEYSNQFTLPDWFLVGTDVNGVCLGCGTSTATVDDSDVSLAGASWSINDFGQTYSIYFDGETDVSMFTTLTKDPGTASCVATLGSVCDPASIRSGLGGLVYYSLLAADGVTADPLNQLNVWITGNQLTIEIGKALSETSFFTQAYRLQYLYSHEQTVVPVPAAAWLFASGLSLLGFARRRSRPVR